MKSNTTRKILITTAAALLLVSTHKASAQVWQGAPIFKDGSATAPGESSRVFAQTFTAPTTNPELRMLWALAETADVSGTDQANFFVVPWNDATSRPAGGPVFSSGALQLPHSLGRQTMTVPLPGPLPLTPGGRYAILMYVTTAPTGTLALTSLGSDAGDLLPSGSTVNVFNSFSDGGHARQLTTIGIPNQSGRGASMFVSKFKLGVGGVTSANDSGIIGRLGGGASDEFAMFVQKGTAPTGGGGAVFSSFPWWGGNCYCMRDTLLGDTATHEFRQTIGFVATLSGTGVTSGNNLAISRMVGDQFAILAREGSAAPGVAGSQFSAFPGIAKIDYWQDSCMNAVMVLGKLRTGPGGVTSANDEGLWLFDHHGDGHLALREGQTLNSRAGIPKIVKKFAVLSSVPFSPAQRRSHNDVGQVILLVTFTDRTSACVLCTNEN